MYHKNSIQYFVEINLIYRFSQAFFPTRLFNKTMDNMHVSMDFHLQLLHVHVENWFYYRCYKVKCLSQ